MQPKLEFRRDSQASTWPASPIEFGSSKTLPRRREGDDCKRGQRIDKLVQEFSSLQLASTIPSEPITSKTIITYLENLRLPAAVAQIVIQYVLLDISSPIFLLTDALNAPLDISQKAKTITKYEPLPLTDESTETLKLDGSKVEELDLISQDMFPSRQFELQEEQADAIFSRCSKLRAFSGSLEKNAVLALEKVRPTLQSLTLRVSELLEDAAKLLGKMTLTKLDIDPMKGLTEKAIEYITRNTKLQSLAMRGYLSNVSGKIFTSILRCTQLKELVFEGHFGSIKDKDILELQTLKSLKVLIIQGCHQVTDTACQILRKNIQREEPAEPLIIHRKTRRELAHEAMLLQMEKVERDDDT